jgi:hypothetical protein
MTENKYRLMSEVSGWDVNYYVVEIDEDGEHHGLKHFGDNINNAYDYWWGLLTPAERAAEARLTINKSLSSNESRYLACDK